MSQLNDQPVLCKDCKHSFIPWTERFSLFDKRYTMRCRLFLKENEIDKNFVTGHTIKPSHYETCGMARLTNSKNTNCGEAGQFWQPKSKQDLFKLIEHTAEVK